MLALQTGLGEERGAHHGPWHPSQGPSSHGTPDGLCPRQPQLYVGKDDPGPTLLCALLTSLVGGDIHSHVVGGQRALARDTVDGLHLKGVARVGQEMADVDPAFCEAQLPRHKLHVVITA